MNAQPERHLRVVDAETGEVTDFAAVLQQKDDLIAGLQRDVAAEHFRFEQLKRDKAREARANARWPEAKDVFDYWREKCGHPRSTFDVKRFELILPHLEKHGVDLCKRAILGAATDPFCVPRKNGSVKKHDGIGLIFRDAEHFEDFVNRSPIPPKTEPTLFPEGDQ